MSRAVAPPRILILLIVREIPAHLPLLQVVQVFAQRQAVAARRATRKDLPAVVRSDAVGTLAQV